MVNSIQLKILRGGVRLDQHSDTLRRNLYLQPEKRLMLAVLEDAIFCFKKSCQRLTAKKGSIP
jgi:hypothetical protein